MKTKLYNWLILDVFPYIRFTTYYSNFKGISYHIGYKLLQPGDIILTRDKNKLSTLMIGGLFSHACLCISKDEAWEISEMTHKNYNKVCFFDICKESTRVVILRCKDFDNQYISKVIERCKSFENALYDTEFSFGNSKIPKLYCSELIYESDFEHRLKVKLDKKFGIKYITPDDIFKAENIEIVWDSKEED